MDQADEGLGQCASSTPGKAMPSRVRWPSILLALVAVVLTVRAAVDARNASCAAPRPFGDLDRAPAEDYLAYLEKLERVDYQVKRAPRHGALHTNVGGRLATPTPPATRNFLRAWVALKRRRNGTLLGNYSGYAFAPSIQVVGGSPLADDALDLVRQYYRQLVAADAFKFGDSQAMRHYAHNETASRLIQYELLPLVEELLGGVRLRPTYSYLSYYLGGADLRQHTDGEECAVSVSLIVDKPPGAEWPLYVAKRRERIKFRGHRNARVNYAGAYAVDGDAGGLIIFSGTDHVHFRPVLQEEYYSVLLLHYCPVAGCDADPMSRRSPFVGLDDEG